MGRSPLCDLVLDDSEASRRHARVALMDEQAWIVDLGSANGTLVDGDAATRVRLRDGAEILLGNTRLRLRAARTTDDLLPHPLGDDGFATGPGATRAERLRRLAGAQTCSWADGAHPLLQWEGGATWDDLGPVRRLLVERFLETA